MMANHDLSAMDGIMKLAHIEKDSKGAPIFEVDGEKFFYKGKSVNGHLVWQSATRQLVFRAPDFDTMDKILNAEEFEIVVNGSAFRFPA